MNPIAIIGPMAEEIVNLRKHMQSVEEIAWHDIRFYRGILFGTPCVLVQSGVGKVFSALIAQHLIDCFQPSSIILTGVAGALNSTYEIGDIVIGKDYVQHDMNCEELGFKRGQIPFTDMCVFTADPSLFSVACAFQSDLHKVHIGRIISGDLFLTQREMKTHTYIFNELKGDAVEMEAAAIAQVCKVNGDLPFLGIKTISDKADGQAAVDFTSNLLTVVNNTTSVIKHMLGKTI